MTTMAERWDAGSAVAGGAPAIDTGDWLESLRDEAGLIVGTVDAVVRTLTGHDLVASIVEPFAGDFATIASMQQGWRQVATSLGAVGGNHADLAGQLPGAWSGRSEEAAADCLGDLSDVSAHQAEAAELIAQQLGHVLEVSSAAAETVCAALRLIDDIVAQFLLKQLAGPVGTALSAVTLPRDLARLVAWIRRAEAAVRRVIEVVEACLEAVATIQRVLDFAAAFTEAVAVAGHARAGAMADETAQEGF